MSIKNLTFEELRELPNSTPFGLASDCWSRDLDWQDYLFFCDSLLITPITSEEFVEVYKLWTLAYVSSHKWNDY